MSAKKKMNEKLIDKKSSAKKSTVKKVPAKSAKKELAAKPAPAAKKITAVAQAMTKTQMMTTIAESTQLTRKQVQSVMDELSSLIEAHVKKKSVGNFTLPGLLKLKVIDKPATKARKGLNPFTGEEAVFKAKPASRKVKVIALSKLKGMVNS